MSAEPTLEAALRAAAADGLREFQIRVSRYEADCTTPAAFQAIAKYHDAKRPWGIGIRSNPSAAALAALTTRVIEREQGAFG